MIRTNVCGTLALADLTCARAMHMTLFATGCIFEYDAAHPVCLACSPCRARCLPVRVSCVCTQAASKAGGGALGTLLHA